MFTNTGSGYTGWWNRFLGSWNIYKYVLSRLHWLAESIPCNRLLSCLNVYKFGLCSFQIPPSPVTCVSPVSACPRGSTTSTKHSRHLLSSSTRKSPRQTIREKGLQMWQGEEKKVDKQNYTETSFHHEDLDFTVWIYCTVQKEFIICLGWIFK